MIKKNIFVRNKKNMKKPFSISLLAITIMLLGCDRLFEYTPYSANVRNSFTSTTAQNLEKLSTIEQETQGKDEFKIALISDSHIFYNGLADMINLINQDEDVLFVIHGGDLSDGGMLKEFEIFHDLMNKLKKPYFTVIGNHDCLVNGRSIYNEMFGEENYSFVFKNCKFIFFNDIVWELNFEEPDFLWLQDQLENSEEYSKVFVIAHIPPWSDQFSMSSSLVYQTLMDTSNVDVSIHGHHHEHEYLEYYNDSVKYLIIGAPHEGSFCKLEIFEDSVHVEKINF